MSRAPRVAICGDGIAGPLDSAACHIGRRLAEAGCIVLTGGFGGVMAAASEGAYAAGGIVIGILPTYEAEGANQHVTIPICTGMGHARNAILVASADVVVAIGGMYGTLSEIALGRKLGKHVILHQTWDIPVLIGNQDPMIQTALTPDDVVAKTCALLALTEGGQTL